MSRSGYSDGECDSVEDMLRMCGWQANVRRCIGGRSGQAFLWELYQALEALPQHRLIQGALVDQEGAACSLGAVALARGMEIPAELRQTDEGDPDEYDFAEAMGPYFGIKDMLAREVMFENDECDRTHRVPGPPARWNSYPTRDENSEERWLRMRRWVVSRLKGIP